MRWMTISKAFIDKLEDKDAKLTLEIFMEVL